MAYAPSLPGPWVLLAAAAAQLKPSCASSDPGSSNAANQQPLRTERWSGETAREWGAQQPWRLGANYLPSTSANVLEMFEPSNFNATLLVVERELRVARAAGFSTMRIFLHEELFFRHADEFLRDVDRLLMVLQRHNMAAMLVLFDACWRPDLENARVIPGVHNSAWVQCPPHRLLKAFAAGEAEATRRLHAYVAAVVAYFATDRRVVVWDIYNEVSMRTGEHWILPRLGAIEGWRTYPEHWLLDGVKFEAAFKLLEAAFGWARSAGPMQPLTTAVWDFPTGEEDEEVVHFKHLTNARLVELSDVISMHCYCDPEEFELRLQELSVLQRGPILVTEFMARPRNATLQDGLPILRRHGAWGYTWGLFRGRSQTHRPWDSWVVPDIPEDALWFHDVFYENGTAYEPEELKAVWWHAVGLELKL